MGRFREMLYKISSNIKLYICVIMVAIFANHAYANNDLSDNYDEVVSSIFIVHTLETYSPILEGNFSDSSPFKSLENLPKEMPKPTRLGKGTGFLISEDGYVVTNDHVISSGNRYILIDSDKKEYTAKLVGTDKFSDLAILQIEDIESIKDKKPLSFAKTDPKIGVPVYIIGHPINMMFVLSSGHITAVDTNNKSKYSKFIQTDAVVNKGNSGGPMFNDANEIIGVVTALVSPTGYYIGYGYATPPSVATKILEELLDKGYIWRPVIGFTIVDINDKTREYIPLLYRDSTGVYVSIVQPDSPASKAGIKAGDIVTSVNGQDATVNTLINIINNLKELESIELNILRISANKKETFKLKIIAKNKE